MSGIGFCRLVYRNFSMQNQPASGAILFDEVIFWERLKLVMDAEMAMEFRSRPARSHESRISGTP
jgi:hypothetical protein